MFRAIPRLLPQIALCSESRHVGEHFGLDDLLQHACNAACVCVIEILVAMMTDTGSHVHDTRSGRDCSHASGDAFAGHFRDSGEPARVRGLSP